MIVALGEIAGLPEGGERLAREVREGLEATREKGERLLRRPRTFFELWPDPLVSCAGWQSELLEIAGAEEIFPELRGSRTRQERIVDPAEVARREPEVILGSWPGRCVEIERIRMRPGWDCLPAIRRGKIFEMESSLISRPGLKALTAGLNRLHEIIADASLG
jgi:iron complex transport system substrate-binding protein